MATNDPVVTSTSFITTAGVHQTMQDHPDIGELILRSLGRHLTGDWGTLDPDGTEENNRALAVKDRLLSNYPLDQKREVSTNYGAHQATSFWIITDAGWETTTILWPVEY